MNSAAPRISPSTTGVGAYGAIGFVRRTPLATARTGTPVERELRSVLADDPPRPRELENGAEEVVRRARDVEQLWRYMRCINRAVLDEHLRTLG